jgi:hypothetical protein
MFPQSYLPMSEKQFPTLEIRRQMLTVQRDPKESHKIGLEVGSLLWMGEDYVLKIDSPRIPYRDYPDYGSSSQIYSNPDPLPYVELEVLHPIHQMRRGDVVSKRVRYTLLRRSEVDPALEAGKLLKP